MTRIPTIESALKSAYHDCHQSTDAMGLHVIKALGAEGEQINPHAVEQRISRHLAAFDPADFRALAEEIDAMLPRAEEPQSAPEADKLREVLASIERITWEEFSGEELTALRRNP